MKIKEKHTDSIVGRMLKLKKQMNYHEKEIQPYYSQMEKWEEKEYKSVYEENKNTFEEYKAYIKEKEVIFNNLLSEYGLSVSMFIYYLNHKLN